MGVRVGIRVDVSGGESRNKNGGESRDKSGGEYG